MKTEYPRLNVDYILTLKRNGDTFYLEEKEIERSLMQSELLDEINKANDLPTAVKSVHEYIGRRHSYAYCWPYDYTESFISPAELPNEAEGLDRYDSIPYINKILYEKWGKKQLEQYREKIIRFIYAQCYEETLKQLKKDTKILMYSNDIKGWYKPRFVITDEVTISLYTNFCYGVSSYFYIGLCYKGIQILPYDDIVNYYWSRMMDNIRYTVDYYPDRSNWGNALQFVKEISEMIMRDNKEFEQVWIVDRLEKMMKGLKQINDNIIQYFFVQKQKSEDASNTDDRVYKYRNISQEEIKCCNIYRDEQLLAIQVDKFSAALGFLDDLKGLKSIYKPVERHIKTLIQYNTTKNCFLP